MILWRANVRSYIERRFIPLGSSQIYLTESIHSIVQDLQNGLCFFLLANLSIKSTHLNHGRAHSPTFLSLHLHHNSFSNPSVAFPTSQLILQPFRRFTYVTVHSPTLILLLLRHSSFSNPYFASPTSQLILQPFFRFSYVTTSSLNSPGELPMVNKWVAICNSQLLLTFKKLCPFIC